MMELRIQSISDRLHCIAEDPTALELTRLAALEVIHHMMEIDACTQGYRLTNEQLDRCQQRIIVFASTQFKNRN